MLEHQSPAFLPAFELVYADWLAPRGVHAFTTCRRGGVSGGSYGALQTRGAAAGLNLGMFCGDEKDRVIQNRQILRRSLPAEPHWLQQVHGSQVLEFESAALGTADHRRQGQDRNERDAPDVLDAHDELDAQFGPLVADAAITCNTAVVLSVLSADCLPIFMCNGEADAVGICHAGWRGLAGGVIEASASAIQRRRPHSTGWIAHLGPAIGPTAFEVGEDVRQAFCDQTAADETHFVATRMAGKYLANLYELASRRLRAAGFQTITGGAYCTFRDQEHFYSHRRDQPTGRMASLIWIEN
jgi:polyphenol oxidase